jgi:hypothetical protein
MTPPATAAAAAPRFAPGSRRRAAARPRRVSGQAPSARAATAAAVAIPAPGVALPRRRAAAPKRRPARAHEPRGVALRVIDAVEGISSSSLLDRLIRGRLWIGLLAFALIGIVAMHLLVLELNTGIGRKLTRVAALQIANAQLGIEDSGASAEARIDPLASASGMTFAPSGSVHFLAASQADVARAASALSTSVKAPVAGSSESSSSESGEASSSSQVAETIASGSEAGASTETTATAESGSSETSSEPHETQAPATGQTASSASSSETASSSSESAAASPTGAGGGVEAGPRG